MAPSTLNLDITILPQDTLLLCDEPFYDLVGKLADPIEAKLLQVQGVRSVYSLLYIDDIFDILKYQCKQLDEIKKDACLLLDDDRQIIKPRCKSNLKYFTQLLRLKNQEHLKTIGLKIKSKCSSNDGDNSNISILQSSAQVLPQSSSISQDTTTTTTSQTNELKRRTFLKTTLDEWLYKNKSKLNLSGENLIERTDYTLILSSSQASQEAFTLCACGVRINLPKERAHFSLSNYYNHIKTPRCTMVKNFKKAITDDTNDEEIESSQEEISDTDIVDISTTPTSNISNNNKQSHYSFKKGTNAGSHSVSSKKLRHH